MELKHVILFPAIFIGSVELLYSIKSMDMDYILAIYRKKFVHKFNPGGNYLIDEFESPKQTIAKIDEYCKKNNVCIDGIISIDDELQFKFSKKLARHYNLEFYNDITLDAASNKYIMKTQFNKFNVPTSRFTLYSGPDKEQTDYIGFPNVLKILSGSGSECIFLNDNLEELEQNFNFLKNQPFSKLEIQGNIKFFTTLIDDIKIVNNRRYFTSIQRSNRGGKWSLDKKLKESPKSNCDICGRQYKEEDLRQLYKHFPDILETITLPKTSLSFLNSQKISNISSITTCKTCRDLSKFNLDESFFENLLKTKWQELNCPLCGGPIRYSYQSNRYYCSNCRDLI